MLLTIDPISTPPDLGARVLELRARAARANNDPFSAARIRVMLDAKLEGQDREINRAQIIETLAGLDDATLRQKTATLAADDALLPWIEQAFRTRGQMLPRELPRPQRPVGP